MKILKNICLLLIGINLLACQSTTEKEEVNPANVEEEKATSKFDCPEACAKNCVTYIGTCKGVSLPGGLWTIQDKKSKLDNFNYACERCVAIIDNGTTAGHLAYIYRVYDSGNIRISEGNWDGEKCGNRYGTPGSLDIVGYYNPNYPLP